METDDADIDSNWGWCDEWCNRGHGREQLAKKLKETRLDVLERTHCKKLIKRGTEGKNVIIKWEMCAGKKKPFETIKVFEKNENTFTFKDEHTDFLGLDGNYDMDFYVSGTDSCQGDSGGPLYT